MAGVRCGVCRDAATSPQRCSSLDRLCTWSAPLCPGCSGAVAGRLSGPLPGPRGRLASKDIPRSRHAAALACPRLQPAGGSRTLLMSAVPLFSRSSTRKRRHPHALSIPRQSARHWRQRSREVSGLASVRSSGSRVRSPGQPSTPKRSWRRHKGGRRHGTYEQVGIVGAGV